LSVNCTTDLPSNHPLRKTQTLFSRQATTIRNSTSNIPVVLMIIGVALTLQTFAFGKKTVRRV
jgi:hypothetical protein